jgi:hypothetical protein
VRNLRAITAKPGRITLVWSNPAANDLAGIVVRRAWGACPATPKDGVPVGGNTVRARQVDTGAADTTTYCYGVFAFDRSHNYSHVALDPGVLNPGVVATPKPVTDLRATADGSNVLLSWRNPVNAGLAYIAVRRGPATGCPTGPADGIPIGGQGVRTTETDTTAQPGVAYCYRVFALNAAAHASATTADANITTPQPEAPTPSHPSSSSGGGGITSTLVRAVAGIAVMMLLVMAAAMAVTRRRSHTSAYAAPQDFGPRLAISGYTPVALVIPALLVLGSCAAIVLVLINL